jgi:hypothetical protein
VSNGAPQGWSCELLYPPRVNRHSWWKCWLNIHCLRNGNSINYIPHFNYRQSFTKDSIAYFAFRKWERFVVAKSEGVLAARVSNHCGQSYSRIGLNYSPANGSTEFVTWQALQPLRQPITECPPDPLAWLPAWHVTSLLVFIPRTHERILQRWWPSWPWSMYQLNTWYNLLFSWPFMCV